ncbi:DUF2686 family protein, partial [Escherichia coli]|nr:DUF2686 family protein [Escherichia coli]
AHAATELAEGLRLNLFMKSPFDPVEGNAANLLI